MQDEFKAFDEKLETQKIELKENLKTVDGELRDLVESRSLEVIDQLKEHCQNLINRVASTVLNTEQQINSLNKRVELVMRY